jgi:hypothetical protein
VFRPYALVIATGALALPEKNYVLLGLNFYSLFSAIVKTVACDLKGSASSVFVPAIMMAARFKPRSLARLTKQWIGLGHFAVGH